MAEVSVKKDGVEGVVAKVDQELNLQITKTSHLTTFTESPKTPYVPSYNVSSYIQGLGFLFLMLALLWVGVRFLRRYGRFNFLPRPDDLPKDALRMEAQLPLGPRKGLMVVRFLHKRLLLGVTDQQISVLTEEPVNDEEKASFEELVDQAKNSKS